MRKPVAHENGLENMSDESNLRAEMRKVARLVYANWGHLEGAALKACF
jgi:hypothetical protein